MINYSVGSEPEYPWCYFNTCFAIFIRIVKKWFLNIFAYLPLLNSVLFSRCSLTHVSFKEWMGVGKRIRYWIGILIFSVWGPFSEAVRFDCMFKSFNKSLKESGKNNIFGVVLPKMFERKEEKKAEFVRNPKTFKLKPTAFIRHQWSRRFFFPPYRRGLIPSLIFWTLWLAQPYKNAISFQQ